MSPTARDDMPVRRIDRILAFMSVGLLVLSVGCFFAVLISRPAGVTDYSAGIWPTVILLPSFGLPLAFVLIIVVLVMSFVRRARANKGR
ncbi:multidrug ABC transporter ATPase [Microbacterium hatanonis]|jgi:FtsH-binding integral membrane protein|uniref:Multidrug ABC transporter ATPase n=1 Tax=Microbacterium hatanonis TaxID=404366 RepID=A0A5C8I2K2_9MICO|nr:multidrug ABC transporter ATPase [Microbacterium hatanonis]TXK12310.1 multidrug ABC transporter ATPase [Microbacterium hatanonis]